MENLSCDQLDHCDNLLGLLVGEGCRPSTVSQLFQAYWQKVTELGHDKKLRVNPYAVPRAQCCPQLSLDAASLAYIHAQAAQSPLLMNERWVECKKEEIVADVTEDIDFSIGFLIQAMSR